VRGRAVPADSIFTHILRTPLPLFFVHCFEVADPCRQGAPRAKTGEGMGMMGFAKERRRNGNDGLCQAAVRRFLAAGCALGFPAPAGAAFLHSSLQVASFASFFAQ
jgi:hypothetical protein